MKHLHTLMTRVSAAAVAFALGAAAPAMAEPVTVDNFVRAESDFNLRANLANLKTLGGDIGRIVHGRDPATVET